MKTAIRYIFFVFAPLIFAVFLISHMLTATVTLNCFKIGTINYNISLIFGKTEIFICVAIMLILFCIQFANIKLEKTKYLRTQIFLNILSILMCFVVCSDNLFTFFIGIESLGLISAIMVGHANNSCLASSCVFIFNKLASILFLLSIIMIAEHTKSFDFQSVRIFFEWTENEEVLILPATLLLISCLCKGAQFPFSKWLLDATVADTYISILLHSVTVVWTGIIFIYKCHFIFERIEFFGEALVFIGGATAIIMALCSLFQVDMKKIIACSTAASIGIAFVACGIKAYDISIIYFICHAFSKSVFFLSVAYIMHIVSKEANILKMGGIGKIAPNVNDIICVSFISTIGFPCFVNFFAKASLLQMTLDIKIILIVITNSVLLMIAFWRLIYLAMYGNSRMDERTMSRVSDLQGSCIIPPWLLLFFAVIGSFASIGMYNMEINYIKQSLFEILQIMIAISIIVILKHRYKKLMPAKIEQVFRDNELSEYFFSFLYTCLVQVQKFFLVIDRKFDNFIHKALQTSTEFLSVSVYKLYKESIENQTRWLFLGIATCIMCAIACSMIH